MKLECLKNTLRTEWLDQMRSEKTGAGPKLLGAMVRISGFHSMHNEKLLDSEPHVGVVSSTFLKGYFGFC